MAKSLLYRRMLRDLARSGIDEKHIKRLQLKTKREDFAYSIPFFNIHGDPIGFTRYRNLKKMAKQKYTQKTNTIPHLYFPPTFRWLDYLKDKQLHIPKLVITEGEKKAIKATLCGIPCVALAGVYNWKSKKRGVELIEDFNVFNFADTTVEICYDGESNSNEQVRVAQNSLAGQLYRANPRNIQIVRLDGEVGDGKQGLDDFLTQFKSAKEARAAFKALRRDGVPGLDNFAEFNHRFVYVVKDELFFDAKHAVLRPSKAMLEDYQSERMPDPDNPNRRCSVMEVWMKTRKREATTVDSLVYSPGREPKYRKPGATADSINTWRPSKIQPMPGKPTLWLDLVHHVFKGAPQKHINWFMQWIAYPMQKPGAKLLQAVFVHSMMEGVGKNFIVTPFLAGIYGPNYNELQGDLLEQPFNSWLKNRQFIFIDEVYKNTRYEKYSVMGKLKTLITSDVVQINQKHRPIEELPNFANFYITSNRADALVVSEDARRFFIVHANETKLPEVDAKQIDNWARNENGIAQVYNYLLNKVDLAGFNPKGEAPRTKARKDAVAYSVDNATQSIAAMFADPEEILRAASGDLPDLELYSAADILKSLNIYRGDHRLGSLREEPQVIAMLMRRHAFVSRKISVRSASKVNTFRFYALLNPEKWASVPNTEWATHLREHRYTKALSNEDKSNADDKPSKVVSLKEARERRAKK